MNLTVIKPGFQDLVQDLGRDGYTHLGISPTGAADKASMKIANLLLGNNVNDPVIEILESGKCLIFIILDYGHMGQHFHENPEKSGMP